MTRPSLVCVAAGWLSAAPLLGAAPTDQAPPHAPLVMGNRALAVALYRDLAAADENLFFSPLSVSTALAMTYAGARGQTADEMKAALRFPLGPDALHPVFRSLNRAVADATRGAGLEMLMANGLCLTGGDVSPAFKALLQEFYEADLLAGDADRINEWVRGKTRGKIEKILDQLAPRSVCVLLNAIYFKGRWERPFDARQTEEAPFRVSADREAPARFMHRQDRYALLERPDFQALLLPYAGRSVSMAVLLPRDANGLAAFEQQLDAETLAGWLADLDQAPARQTDVYLPAFKLETGYDLAPPFQALGMRAAFNNAGQADFSGMGYAKGQLFISQIKHHAVIEVNEEGTEAAAATAVEMALTAVMQPPPVFRADHPFLFLIRDQATGSILFMGRVADPAGR